MPPHDALEPEAGAAEVGLARAHEPGEAHHLAAPHVDRDVVHEVLGGDEVLDLQQGLGRVALDVRKDLVDDAAGHQLHELLVGGFLDGDRVDVHAVAQHGDAVADPLDLVHAVGDVDDADAFGLDLLDQLEQPVGLALRERGGRLVEDHDRGPGAEGLGDLHHLLLGAGEVHHLVPAPEREAEAVQRLARLAGECALVEDGPPRQLVAEEQVLLDRELRHQREFLEHGAHAELARMVHRVDDGRLAPQVDGPAGRPVDAGDDLDQRRLAGAVLTEEDMHLARLHVEIDAVERERARKLLG